MIAMFGVRGRRLPLRAPRICAAAVRAALDVRLFGIAAQERTPRNYEKGQTGNGAIPFLSTVASRSHGHAR